MENTEDFVSDEKSLFQSLFKRNSSPMLLIETDTGKIQDTNEAAKNFYGYKNLDSLNIKTINQLSEKEVEAYLNATVSERKKQFEFKHKLANGEIRIVEVCSTPVTFHGEKLLFSIVHDITDKKEAEQSSKILSDATFSLLELKTPDEIYKYIVDKLYSVLKESSIVTIVEYDNPRNYWKMKEVRGVNPFLDKTLKKLGIDITEMEGEIKTDYLTQMQAGKLTELEFDLPHLTNNKYSERIASAFKKVFSVKGLLVIPLHKGGVAYGNVTIITTNNTAAFNRRLVEAFISQAATFLEKIIIENDLRESQQKLVEAEKIAQLGNFEINLNTSEAVWSEETFNICGLDHKKDKAPTVEEYAPLVHPDDRENLFNLYNECIEKNKKFDLVYRINRADNNIRYVHSVAQIRKSVGDKPAYMFGTFQDITNQKRMEIALQKSENYFRSLIENSTDIVSILDEKGFIIYKSPSHLNILGYSHDDMAGKNTLDYIHKEDIPKVTEQFKDLIKRPGGVSYLKFRYKHRNGKWIYLEATVKNMLQNQSVEGIVVNSRDVTERIQFQKELIKAKEKAEESERLKTAFLANMSHEIRTPMNGILGFIDVLNEPDITKDEKDTYLDLVKKSGERLLNTINDIIEISKIEANQTYLNFSDENLNEIMNDHLDFFKPESAAKNITLKISDKSEHQRVIRTDKNKLDSIFTNLIKNAIKFTSDGEIEFGCQQKNGQLQFFVKDTGIGIAGEKIEAIFNRFEQAELGINRGHEGTGLGLSISKAYSEMLGGKLWAESEQGKGSTFRFTINHLPPAQKKTVAHIESPDKSVSDQRAKILVVEDDEISFLLVESYLSIENFELLNAKNGEEAIQMVKENPEIDLVLMDVKMPGMDGYTATREIRKLNKEIPIIAQTAYALEGDRGKAIEAGCDDYVSKPLRKNELIQKIKGVIG